MIIDKKGLLKSALLTERNTMKRQSLLKELWELSEQAQRAKSSLTPYQKQCRRTPQRIAHHFCHLQPARYLERRGPGLATSRSEA